MNSIKEQLLQGNLPMPLHSKLGEKFPSEIDVIERLWNSLWHNFLADEGSTNTTYWYKQFKTSRIFNTVLMAWSDLGWIESHAIPQRNWAEMELNKDKLLEFVSVDELAHIRATQKYQKYTLTCDASRASRVVRINGKSEKTGLVRNGFRDAGETQFGYDMTALSKYEEAVKRNLTKSMDKIRADYPDMRMDEASYDKVSCYIYDYHAENEEEVFTTGTNLNDSRGRAISQSLKRIANPISNKDFRASLVITYDEA